MKSQLYYYYGFLFGSLVISLTIQFVFPGLVGMLIALGIYIVMPLLFRYGLAGKLKQAGFSSMLGSSKGDKICLVCSKKSNHKDQCSRCGSRQFKYI